MAIICPEADVRLQTGAFKQQGQHSLARLHCPSLLSWSEFSQPTTLWAASDLAKCVGVRPRNQADSGLSLSLTLGRSGSLAGPQLPHLCPKRSGLPGLEGSSQHHDFVALGLQEPLRLGGSRIHLAVPSTLLELREGQGEREQKL